MRNLQGDDQPESAYSAADYLLLLLFTGLRAREAATLRWEQIDLTNRMLTIPYRKNHQPLTLPLSDYLHKLLTARRMVTTSAFVFPGRDNLGPLVEVKRQVRHFAQSSGVTFCLHDLRRTFVTVADSLDIPAYAIKRLVNHIDERRGHRQLHHHGYRTAARADAEDQQLLVEHRACESGRRCRAVTWQAPRRRGRIMKSNSDANNAQCIFVMNHAAKTSRVMSPPDENWLHWHSNAE